MPRLAQTTVDLRLPLFALAVVAGTALLFGLIPAMACVAPARRAARVAPMEGMREGSS